MSMELSIWEKESFFAPQDIVIIGSGFTGLWSAFFLKKKAPSLRITIVEGGLIPTGASSRNAGFACFGSLGEVVHDARVMGTDKMLELVEARFLGLERIQKYFGKSSIDFGLCGGYELFGGNTTAEQLQEDADYINALLKPVTGTKKTYRLVDDSIQNFGFGQTAHMVKNNMEGYLHSGKLLQALLRKVQGLGVQVINSIRIHSLERDGDGFYLPTDRGVGLRAGKVLLCTNAFTKSLFPAVDIVPARGQVLLTSPIEGLPWQGTFHADEGYYYFRNLDNRVLLGGARNKAFENETTVDMRTSPFIQEELQRYLDEVILPGFRGQYSITDRWAGIMAMGSEKLPIVGELDKNIFAAVRMSGMGVALAPVVSRKVAGMML